MLMLLLLVMMELGLRRRPRRGCCGRKEGRGLLHWGLWNQSRGRWRRRWCGLRSWHWNGIRLDRGGGEHGLGDRGRERAFG